MAVFVVLSALVFWAGVFAVYFVSQGSSPLEYLLGHYEPLAEDSTHWTASAHESGLLREERLLLPGNRSNSAFLLRQVRYRDALTREIVRVDPEQRVRRRRVRSANR